MHQEPRIIPVTRRNVLKLGGAALAAGVSGTTVDLLNPQTGNAQAPKRGGVFRLPLSPPPMFDHQLTVNWSTQISRRTSGTTTAAVSWPRGSIADRFHGADKKGAA